MTSRAGVPAARGGPARLLRGEHDLVVLAVVGRRLAAVDRAAEVGAVAVDDAAEVEHDRGALRDRAPGTRLARVEVVGAETREDVRREGGAARPGEAEVVLDRLGELGHRDARDDERRRRRHRLLDRRRSRGPSPSSSSADLTRRSSLTMREPVRSRSAPTMLPSSSVVSAQTRSPTATAPPPPAAARAARAKMARPSSVSATTTSSPAGCSRRSKAANMRGRTNTGSAPGRKKAPVTHPWA